MKGLYLYSLTLTFFNSRPDDWLLQWGAKRTKSDVRLIKGLFTILAKVLVSAQFSPRNWWNHLCHISWPVNTLIGFHHFLDPSARGHFLMVIVVFCWPHFSLDFIPQKPIGSRILFVTGECSLPLFHYHLDSLRCPRSTSWMNSDWFPGKVGVDCIL